MTQFHYAKGSASSLASNDAIAVLNRYPSTVSEIVNAIPECPLFSIAVGTAVAGGPPHRSVREELPHTAPTLGRTSRQRLAHSSACAADGEFGTVSGHPRGRRVPLGRTPSLGRLRPRESHPRLFACVVGTTSSSDFPAACMSAVPSWTFADRSDGFPSEAVGISRFSRLEFSDMLRFFDSAVPLDRLPLARSSVLPSRRHHRVGTREG